MGREVWLTVTGEQKDADGRQDRNSTQIRAWYERREDKHIFEYREALSALKCVFGLRRKQSVCMRRDSDRSR